MANILPAAEGITSTDWASGDWTDKVHRWVDFQRAPQLPLQTVNLLETIKDVGCDPKCLARELGLSRTQVTHEIVRALKQLKRRGLTG